MGPQLNLLPTQHLARHVLHSDWKAPVVVWTLIAENSEHTFFAKELTSVLTPPGMAKAGHKSTQTRSVTTITELRVLLLG